jgi:DMSO/TMAO reductase YedYZ molybdopterin-dependent catalytic subunit
MSVVGAVGLGGYLAAEAIARSRQQPGAPTRFTGSRRAGSFSGNNYPVTESYPARLDQIDPATWRLSVTVKGHEPLVLAYPDLLALPAVEKTATVDCTLGWYSTQVWRGVPLTDVLSRAGIDKTPAGIRFTSVTGYAHTLPYEEARDVLLATHVGGETLSSDHGFPVRAVVPSRRGWFWVKWLAKIEPVDALNEVE